VQYKQHKLTIEGKGRLEAELENIKTVERPQLAQSLKEWHEGGDVTDNAAFEAMKERLAALGERAAEIKSLLREAEIINGSNGHVSGVVEVGSVVSVKKDDGQDRQYTIVDSLEAAPQDYRISDASPIGSALLGCRVGDVVTVQVPNRTLQLTITEVR
jgi:transcription elongation factor GreA